MRKDSSVGSKAVRDESMASYSDGMVLPKTKKDLAGTGYMYTLSFMDISL